VTRTVLKIVLNVAIYAAIVVGILWGVPKFLIWKFGTDVPIAAITSGSMWPALKTGDMILIRAVSKPDIAEGDIVVWRNAEGFTIHRVVRTNATTLVTKGDANFSEDPPVTYEDVVGEAVEFRPEQPFRIPYIGYISIWASRL